MSATYGLDDDVVTPNEALASSLRRRVGGRYPVDPFGLDPQLCDLVAPGIGAVVRVHVEHPERIPSTGPAVLVSNRGLGIAEPAALAVAVRDCAQRRLRVVGAPNVPFLGSLCRRFGAVSASAADLASVLAAGHLVAVPMTHTWLRTGAGTPPLPLVQVMMWVPVVPVAVRPDGPLGSPTSWSVTIGETIPFDRSYSRGDPLGAAELGEAVRSAVDALLSGSAPAASPDAGW